METKKQALLFMTILINVASGIEVIPPEDLQVKILDGKVIAFWKDPKNVPQNFYYNVQIAKYGKYVDVPHCTTTTENVCLLNSGIHDYNSAHKVRIQLVAGEEKSMWTAKRFQPNESELSPPTLSLVATSSTLTIHIKNRPILKKLFPFGVTYTIYLQERGKDIKNTRAELKDDAEGNVELKKVFTSLHWGVEYCVSIKVEGNGALSVSNVSEPHCLHLPEQEWFIIATSSLSVLGVLSVLAFIGSILVCYLRCPAKTPSSLTTPIKAWHPLSVEEGTVEVVTDKGWFLSNNRTNVNNSEKLSETHAVVTESKEQESRRISLDSGVTIESNSITTKGKTTPLRQEDSGCGSMGAPGSSTSSQTDYPIDIETTGSETMTKSEDSRMYTNCQLDSSSRTSDGQENMPLVASTEEGNYRRQNPAPHVCDDKDVFEQTSTSSVLAEATTGYRAGPQSCICSGVGQCSWCHRFGHQETCATKIYGDVSFESELCGRQNNLWDSHKRTVTFSGYSSKTPNDTLMMNDIGTTFLQLGKTVPLPFSLPLAMCEQKFSTNNVPLSLFDIKLVD